MTFIVGMALWAACLDIWPSFTKRKYNHGPSIVFVDLKYDFKFSKYQEPIHGIILWTMELYTIVLSFKFLNPNSKRSPDCTRDTTYTFQNSYPLSFFP